MLQVSVMSVPPHLWGGEGPSSLVLHPWCHLSLQIPRLDGEYDLKMPRDMAYVFGGAYVPLSCKIIEQVSSSAAGESQAHPLKALPLGECSTGSSAPGQGWWWSEPPEQCPQPA